MKVAVLSRWLLAAAAAAAGAPTPGAVAAGVPLVGGGADENGNKNDGIPASSFGSGGGGDDGADPHCPLFSDARDGEELRRTLNVHLVPHTHDDTGWLKTVDQYYYGWNNTIQQAHVGLVLDSVLAALLDPHTAHERVFTYVETKFFSMWYATLPPSSKQALKGLIDEKRFSFANGGWCMHDEANTHFVGMIDQTALGHKFLKDELGVVPSVGWQIDPFGHSATQGGLFTSGVGFDSLFFGRIHHVDLEHRRQNAECEGLWSSTVDDAPVFWGLTGSYGGNYGAPEGFCFDAFCDDEPLVGEDEDVLLERIKKFTIALGVQANMTKGRNLMLTMGMDFHYSHAEKNFRNMDLLIDATNRFLSNGSIEPTDVFGDRFNKVNVFYSTPERYTKCKYVDKENTRANGAETPKYDPATWTGGAKAGDFFPYADCDHCYWAGYFSSRQGLKGMERAGSSFLHAARQVEAMTRVRSLAKGDAADVEAGTGADATKKTTERRFILDESPKKEALWNKSPLYTLDDAVGIVESHDAVSGTSKQHVAYDYAKMLAKGMSDASSFVADGLRGLLFERPSGMLENLRYCHLLNVTVCEVSQEASRNDGQAIYVIVYNALAKTRHEAVSLPVDLASDYVVERLEDSAEEWSPIPVDSALVPNPNYANVVAAAPFALHFRASNLPPLGASVFRISKAAERLGPNAAIGRRIIESKSHLRAAPSSNEFVSQTESDDLEVSNGVLSVKFDRSTGVIKTISEQHEDGVTVTVENKYGFYEAFFHEDPESSSPFKFGDSVKGNGANAKGGEMPWLLGTADSMQNSGAYIFRPTPDQSFHDLPPRVVPNLLVYESDLVTEVHAEFGEPAWIKQITRLVDGKDYVEVEYVVGPVPIDDGVGKEVVSRYSTTIRNEGIFYTDSNGREFMKRKRFDARVFGYDTPEFNPDLEPVAGNYYPVNTAVFIEDESSSLGVLVDRSQGGSSLSDGSLELMIQRRLLHDDARGVGEPLNETDVGITACPPFGDSTRLGAGVIVKGTHRLVVGKRGAGRVRSQMDQSFSLPKVFVASAPKGVQVPFRETRLSLLEASLPENVMVVTYAALDEARTFLVRLAHQYGKDEDVTYSGPVLVNLQDLFPLRLSAVTEKTLSANQNREIWEKRRLKWNDDMIQEPTRDGRLDEKTYTITLKPLEIRTFELRASPFGFS